MVDRDGKPEIFNPSDSPHSTFKILLQSCKERGGLGVTFLTVKNRVHKKSPASTQEMITSNEPFDKSTKTNRSTSFTDHCGTFYWNVFSFIEKLCFSFYFLLSKPVLRKAFT